MRSTNYFMDCHLIYVCVVLETSWHAKCENWWQIFVTFSFHFWRSNVSISFNITCINIYVIYKAWIFTSTTTIFLIQPDRPSVHAKCVTNWQEFVRGDQFTYERGREEDTRQARRKIRRSSGHAYVQLLCTPSLRSLEY